MKLKKSLKVVGAVAFSSVVAVSSIFSFGWLNQPVEADGVVQPPYVTGSPTSFDRTITRKLNIPLTTYVKEQHDAGKISDSEYNTLKNLPEIPKGAYRKQDGEINSLSSSDDLSEEDFANQAADLEKNFDKYAAYKEKDGTEQDEKADEDKDKDSESANADDLRGTAEHPFVILEIKPDEDEGAMSFFMSSPEEGLPYDPIQLGKDLMATGKFGTRGFYGYLHDQGTYANVINEIGAFLGGMFANNVRVKHYENTNNIYDYGTSEYYAQKASEMKESVNISAKKYYDVTTVLISESDYNKYGDNVPKLIAANSDYKNIFKKDDNGVAISEVSLEDERNWHSEKSSDPAYVVAVLPSDISNSDFENLSVSQLAKKYPSLFAYDQNGKSLASIISSKTDGAWKKAPETDTVNFSDPSLINGYMYITKAGEGDYGIDSYWWQPKFKKMDNASENMWKFAYSKSELPSGAYDISGQSLNPWNLDQFVNGYISVKDLLNKKGISTIGNESGISQTKYTWKLYAYTYSYYNLTSNDNFIRRLFYKDQDSKYDDFHVQVISLTPDQINAMDKYDTDETTSYIERADMFYIPSFDSKTTENAPDAINFLRHYRKVVAGKATWNDYNKNASVTWHDFNNNDLEWVDCARIIERLCLEKTTPLVYESAVGNLVDKGVNQDGSITNHVYLDKDNTDVGQIGSLNNMAKLYLVAVQFHLPKETLPGDSNQSFLDLYMPKIRQIKLNKPAGTAQYTGWFERLDGKKCTCSESNDYKERSNYLWSKLTFVPDDSNMEAKIGSSEFSQILINSYGFSSYYLTKNAVEQPFDNKKWNGGFSIANGMRYNEIPADGESTAGFDQTNVVFVWDNNANANKNMLMNASEGINVIGALGEFILKRDGVDNSDLNLTIVKNKKEYVRVQNFSQPDTTKKYYEGEVMLDYSRDSKYSKDKTINLKIGVANRNAVRGKIKSIVFKNTTTGKEFDAIKKGLIKDPTEAEPKGTVTYVSWSKSGGVYMTNAGANTILRLSLKRSEWINQTTYSSTSTDANGNPVRTTTAGYDQIEIKTQGRYRDSSGTIKEHPEKTYLIKITGRDLFPLE